MSIQATVYGNSKARQSLNSQYMHQSGAMSMSDVINGFARGSFIFIGLSIFVSTFSVYQDFYKALCIAMGDVIGTLISFMIGLALAVAIEYFRHWAIKGVFNTSFDFLSRVLIGTIAILLLVVALATHFRSLNVFSKIITGDALQAKNQEIAYQRGLTNENVKALVAANVEASKGINNGNAGDDDNVEAITKSNNEMIRTMMVLNGESNKYQTELTIKQSEDMAQTVTGTLFVLFVTIELLAMFSIVSKFLLNRNTDHNVKELATLMDKANQMQDNVYHALGTKILNDAGNNIQKSVKEYAEIENDRGNNRVEKEQVQEEHEMLEAPKESPYSRTKEEKVEEVESEPYEQPLQVRALNMELFTPTQRYLLMIAFKNGTVKPGDSLLKRSEILKKAKELNLKSSAGALTSLLADLYEYGYISIENGGNNTYYCVKPLPQKEIWTNLS